MQGGERPGLESLCVTWVLCVAWTYAVVFLLFEDGQQRRVGHSGVEARREHRLAPQVTDRVARRRACTTQVQPTHITTHAAHNHTQRHKAVSDTAPHACVCEGAGGVLLVGVPMIDGGEALTHRLKTHTRSTHTHIQGQRHAQPHFSLAVSLCVCGVCARCDARTLVVSEQMGVLPFTTSPTSSAPTSSVGSVSE